jgi:hypothetical protein
MSTQLSADLDPAKASTVVKAYILSVTSRACPVMLETRAAAQGACEENHEHSARHGGISGRPTGRWSYASFDSRP